MNIVIYAISGARTLGASSGTAATSIDAADHGVIGQHSEIIIAPLAEGRDRW
jgi:hypothetical protein